MGKFRQQQADNPRKSKKRNFQELPFRQPKNTQKFPNDTTHRKRIVELFLLKLIEVNILTWKEYATYQHPNQNPKI
jgi:hypothetical protein